MRDDIHGWLVEHASTLDLVTIWIVVIGASCIAIGLLSAWWTIRGSHDKTQVGKTLKWQKLGVATAFAINGAYWGIVLLAAYAVYTVNVWELLVVRLLFGGSMLTGAVLVWWFVIALRRETLLLERGRDDRDERQDRRAKNLDARGRLQDMRGRRQDRSGKVGG